MWRIIFNALPDIASIFLALFLSTVALALLFLPEILHKLEYRKIVRIFFASILILMGLIIGIGGVLSNRLQKTEDLNNQRIEREELRSQITTLINSAQIQATKDDLTQGFDRVVAAIKGTPAPIQPPALLPTIENTRIVQKNTISNNPQLPYGLQVIIQSNIVIQPVAIALECNGAIGSLDFFIAGQMAYMSVQKRIKNNIAIIKFSFPPITPESPMVVTLLSKTQIKVVKVYKINP
jgi:hypothetical protein